jgi:tape measure domain-containing protein
MADYKLRIIVEGIDKASAPLKNIGGALGNVAQIAAGVGGAALFGNMASGLMDAARGALDSYAAYERLGTSINSLAAKEALLTGQAGSMQEALAQTAGKSQDLLGWIQKLAIESPFKQEDVAQAFRLSMALGFSTSEAQRLTQAMLNFSTATGAGGESMERVSRALGQIRTKGKLSMEEVNQLTESGVDVMRILADATGKTGQALVKDISNGAISAQAAIEAIIADTERLYSGAGAAAATSMSGLLSTLEEIGGLSGRNLLSGIFKEAQPYLASVVGIVTAPEFQAGLTAWGSGSGVQAWSFPLWLAPFRLAFAPSRISPLRAAVRSAAKPGSSRRAGGNTSASARKPATVAAGSSCHRAARRCASGSLTSIG